MHKRLFALSALLLSVVLAACGGSGSSGSAQKFTLGVSLSTLSNPYFIALDKGIREAAAKDKVDIIETNANNDAATQISQVQDLITKDVDLLILNPVSEDGIVPVVQQANKANIPVITVDRGTSGGKVVSFVETDNVTLGAQAVDYIAQALTKRYGSPKGKIVDLQGLRGSSPAENREKGFLQEMKKYPNIQVVASQAANFDEETAYNLTTNILQAHPDVDAIFAANDDTAVGATKSMQAGHHFFPIGNSKHIFIIGIDGSEQALQDIRNGSQDATISQNPLKEASTAVDEATQYLSGKSVPAHVFYPSQLITADNITSTQVKNYGLWGDEANSK
ncbi:MAG TPA: substrate-binding domain-containing protein [Ktedonobacteraceae bacterium]|jgi:ribose transport system substrate-binding protein|nr:substrate-binding domain-containing protein [Ktedonobacteraceae bacterium]